jgi:hypothetical protein
LLGIVVVVTTLGIGGQMAKAGLVNNNSLTGFAGQSKNIQKTGRISYRQGSARRRARRGI